MERRGKEMGRETLFRARAIILCMAPLALLTIAGDGAAVLFNTPVHYAVGVDSRDVAVGDLNGDGWIDLAVANETPGTVSVLLNDCDGTFGPASLYTVGVAPLAIEIARMDGDIYPDIVTSNSSSNDVSVLLNDGDGTFGAPADYPVGLMPAGIIAEDLNGDGASDVAVVNHNSGSFTVLLNNGDGTLTSSGSYSASGAYIKPSWLAAGRFDADEYLDIVVVKNYRNLYFTASYVQLFRNDGSGGFVTGPTIAIGATSGTATTPLTEDFDGDGDVDIAVSGFAENSYKLAMLLNNGDGTFADPVLHYAGAGGRASCGDFDFDHDPDVAISTEGVSASSFTYILNNGDATFTSALSVHVGDDPMGQASADFDQDGDWDIAVAVLGENSVAVAMSNEDPTRVDGCGPADPGPAVRLHQNRPNPFGAGTALAFNLLRPSRVTLRVYDSAGRLLRTLLDDEARGAGQHEAFWDGSDDAGREVVSGVYLCLVEAGGSASARKVVYIR